MKEFKALTQEQMDGRIVVSLFERELNTIGTRWHQIGSETFYTEPDGNDRAASLTLANQWANQRINRLAAGLYSRTITKAEMSCRRTEEWKQ